MWKYALALLVAVVVMLLGRARSAAIMAVAPELNSVAEEKVGGVRARALPLCAALAVVGLYILPRVHRSWSGPAQMACGLAIAASFLAQSLRIERELTALIPAAGARIARTCRFERITLVVAMVAVGVIVVVRKLGAN